MNSSHCPPDPDALQSYLIRLRDTATQEIEARKPVELEAQDTSDVVPVLIDTTANSLAPQPGLSSETPEEPFSPRLFASLSEAFAHHAGHLVLLGRPGAGKTTTLWMFARERTELCLSDPAQPLPIFLKIDTWNRKTPLADWVRTQMPDLPLQNIPLLYLCDGLDELGGERPIDSAQPQGERFDPRADFLRLAEEQMRGNQFVISCRSAEYEEIRSKMHGCGAVTLLPLGEEKIEEFLASWDRPRLWQALQSDPNLMELARTPLLLSLLCSAIGTDDIDSEQDLQNLSESALFRFYFDRRFLHEEHKFQAQSPGEALPFDQAITRKLLGNLALYMWHWQYDPLTTLDRIEARFHLGEKAEAFLAFACRMHFLRQSPDGQHIAFIHLKFRDFCAVHALQQMLEDRNVHAQWRAVEVLGKLKEQGFPTLLQALEHRENKVRQQAASCLNGLSTQTEPALRELFKQAIPTLLRVLRDKDGEMRERLIAILVRSVSYAVPALQQVFQGEHSTIRWEIASGIAYHYAETDPSCREALALSLAPLMEALKSSDRDRRLMAACALNTLAKRTCLLAVDSRFSHPPRQPIVESGDTEGIPGGTSIVTTPTEPKDLWLQEILPRTIPALVAALHETDISVPQYIVSALAHQKERVFPALLPALHDSDPTVRQRAVSVLIQSEVQVDPAICDALIKSFPSLIQALRSNNRTAQQRATWDITVLTHFTPQADPVYREALQQTMPALWELFRNSDQYTRVAAIRALTHLEVPVVPVLLQDLDNRVVKIRRRAAATLILLAEQGVPALQLALLQSLPTLLQSLLQDTDARVRRTAVSILKELNRNYADPLEQAALSQAVPVLAQTLQNGDSGVKRAAAFLLTQSDEQSSPAFQEALTHSAPILLQALLERDDKATSALSRLAVQRDTAFQEAFLKAVPEVLQVFKRRAVREQKEMASLLSVLGEPIIPSLTQAFQEEDFRVRRMAVLVLAQIQERSRLLFRKSSSPVFSALLQAIEDREARVRQEVVSALIGFDEQAIPILLQRLLQDGDPGVREHAAASLVRFGVPAFPALLQAIQEGDAGARSVAASFLIIVINQSRGTSRYVPLEPPDPGTVKTITQAFPILLKALQDQNAMVRSSIVWLLAEYGDRADSALLNMLSDENLQVRKHTVEILGRRRVVIPNLLGLLQSDNLALRWAALAALYEHGYMPSLVFRPHLHIVLRHRLGACLPISDWVGRSLLKFQMRRSVLQGIPILFADPLEQVRNHSSPAEP